MIDYLSRIGCKVLRTIISMVTLWINITMRNDVETGFVGLAKGIKA